MGRFYDVAVIGGGIIGTFVAYYLSRAAADVCVIERQFPAAGTSGSSQAWILTSLKPPAHYSLMHQKSARLYEALMREHGVDLEFERCGCLWLALNREEWSKLRHEVAELQAAGVDISLVSADEAHRLEPLIVPEAIHGAAFGRQDGTINPFLILRHVTRLAQAFGAEIRTYTEVVGIDAARGHYLLHTTRGRVRARRVVIATGIWSLEIGRMIGFEPPILPARGQVLVSAPQPRHLLTRTIGNVFLRQLRHNGALLIGSLQEPGQDRNVNTLQGIQTIADTVLKAAPSLADVRIVRSFSGVRAIPYDGFPLLGEIPGRPGVFAAISHSGVGLGPILGLVTAEIVTGRRPSYDITPYQIARVRHTKDPFSRPVRFR